MMFKVWVNVTRFTKSFREDPSMNPLYKGGAEKGAKDQTSLYNRFLSKHII